MPTVHFLNVGEGDCSVIEHGSGRVSVIDVCNGTAAAKPVVGQTLLEILYGSGRANLGASNRSRNYGMKDSPTDPIAYLAHLGVSSVFRFILTHPDMDHLDGFRRLCDSVEIANFWDSGARKTKPDFSAGGYEEADWDHYVKVRDGKAGVTVVTVQGGSRFQYANLGEPENRGDGLHLVAPNAELVNAANNADDPNDASYVVVYWTCGGKIIFSGDAHDNTWAHVLHHHAELVKGCAVLIAPHHGRASGRSYAFLDTLRPRLTLFGCARSEHLAYDAWASRDLLHITNNQAGNVILDAVPSGIDVYLQNRKFAESFGASDATKTFNGCFYIGQVPTP